jgi:hypothetical protein
MVGEPTESRSGCDLLVQSQEEAECRGFRGIAVARPVRLLIHSSSATTQQAARELFDALMALARSLGAQVPEGEMPCDCDLRDPCLAQSESQTLNVLVWVGSAAAPDAVEEATVADWLDSRADAEAIPVVPSGQKPDVVAPTRLRDRQVVWWGASADQAALDVFAAAQVVTAERSVFISYSHADGMELAHAVFRVLSEARFSVFLDAFALAPGADFAERIEHRLLNAAFLVLIETPGALASGGDARVRVRAPLQARRRGGLTGRSGAEAHGHREGAPVGAPQRVARRLGWRRARPQTAGRRRLAGLR